MAAAVIAVTLVMIFGAARFFAKTETFISFFSESVNGLDVGAPLKYKGVTIGKVESIIIASNSKTIRESSVAVVYSIDVGSLRRKTGKSVADFETWIDTQIADGLRAKLNYQSIVTGMLYIELDFLAGPNEKYQVFYRGGHEYKEIPSAKSGLAELAKSFEKILTELSQIDFKAIGGNVNKLLANANIVIESENVRQIPQNLNALLVHADQFVTDPELKSAPKNLNDLLLNSNRVLSSTEAEFKALSEAGRRTFANLDSVLKNVDSVVAPQSPLRYELALMIRTLNDSLNSISNLSDYIERNPSSLITGKLNNSKANKDEQ